MEKNPKKNWGLTFFKILLNYTRRLRLPPVFVRDYGKFLHGSAKIRTSWGETWDVKIEEEIFDDGEKYWCFVGEGWRKFVKDLKLKLGEILVFIFNVGDSTFNVSVFGTNCCERGISDASEESDSISDSRSGLMGDNLSFTAVLRRYNAFMMDIPKAFAAETGIAGKSTVKMQNVKGKEWVVKLSIHKQRNGRTRLGKGWTAFFAENKLVVGGKCLFEFDPTSGNLIMKKEGGSSETGSERSPEYMTMRVPAKRGRGRTPKNLLNMELDSDSDEDGSESFAGRGRGRGRTPKNLLNVELDSDSSESPAGRGSAPTIRGRGRGRGRGSRRTPKNFIDADSDFDGDEDDDSEF
ncbi:hypothetical protein ACS0TY_029814 [Phlomoides rotata]